MKAAVTIRERSHGARALAVSAALAAVTVILLLAGAARGEELSDVPAAFVDVGVGAGPMGMGGAVVASVEGPNSLFWNPAGLALAESDREYSVSYCNQLGLVPYSAGSGTHRLGSLTLGLGLLYSGDDVLSETTIILGAASEVHVLPWAPDLGMAVGAAARTRWASFGNNSSEGDQVTGSALGLGLDVGATVPLTATTTVGLAVRDVFNMLSWDSSATGSYGENVPAALSAGVAMRPHEKLVLEVDVDKSLHTDVDDVLRAGAEVELFGMARLRGGYRVGLQDGVSDEYSVGAGASFPAGTAVMTLDLAYLIGDLENTLRFSLSAAL